MDTFRSGRRRRTGCRALCAAALLLSVALAVRPVSAQSTGPFGPLDDSLLQNFSAEFPPSGIDFGGYPHRDIVAAHAERLLREAPDTVDTLEVLLFLNRTDEAAETLRRMIDARSPDLVRAVEIATARNVSAVVRGVVADMRALNLDLPGEAAAHLERVFILFDFWSPQDRFPRIDALDAFIARAAGTEAAGLAEVDRIAAVGPQPAIRRQQLDAVIGRHAGTTAAARALYEKGLLLSRNAAGRVGDPTERLLEVFAIVTELESGAYPSSEWVARAPWLVFDARLGGLEFAPGNAERLLAAYLAFVRDHFALPATGYFTERVRWLVTGPIFDLFDLQGAGVAGVERALDDLERIDAPRAQFMRGVFYADRLARGPEPARPAMRQRARDTLAALAAAPDGGLHARRALATLASLDYRAGEFVAARAGFEAYLAAYPDTIWSWVAALGIGRCHEALGDTDQAVAAFRDVAMRYGSLPSARQQGYLAAASLNEAAFRFDEAADDYDRALEHWVPESVRASGIEIDARVSRIRASLAAPGGMLLERGRALLADDRAAATTTFEELLRTFPDSSLAAEAQRFLHWMRLDAALDLIGPASAQRDEAAALDVLDALGREPWNDIVGIAQILRAALLAAHGERQQAESLMAGALTEWQRQYATGPSRLAPEVERDVADIWRLIVEDTGAWWRSSFVCCRSDAQFRVVDPEVIVQLHGGMSRREMVYPSLAVSDLLFMTREQMGTITSAVNTIHGPRPARPLVSPSQIPQGVTDLLRAYLPQHGCGIGVGITPIAPTTPVVTAVRFTDEARTRAEVGVSTGSTGGGLFLEKDAGVWRVTDVAPGGIC